MDRGFSYILVFFGAGLGGVVRHALNAAIPSALGNAFPWATFLINITGSVAMGALVGWLASRGVGAGPLRLFAATGVLGGYTTFSTFSLETTLLIERHAYIPAFAYVTGSVLFGVVGLWAAMLATRSL